MNEMLGHDLVSLNKIYLEMIDDSRYIELKFGELKFT